MSFFRMKFANGHVYQFPVELLVVHMANAIRRSSPAEYPDIDVATARARDALSLEEQIRYYAMSIPWSELEPYAMLIDAAPVVLNSETAEVTCHEDYVLPSIKEAADAAHLPVMLFVSSLDAQKKPFHVMSVTRNGVTTGAVAMLRGDKDAIGAYTAMLDGASKLLAKHTDAPDDDGSSKTRPIYPH